MLVNFRLSTDLSVTSKYWVCLLITCFFAHGLLLLTDSVVLDGWYLTYWLKQENWPLLGNFLSEAGVPQCTWILRALGEASDPSRVAKWICFGCFYLNGILTYFILLRLAWCKPFDALIVAIIATVCPFFQVCGDLSVIHYSLCYTLYLVGFWLAVVSASLTKWQRGLGRLVSLLLMGMSFLTGSLLLFHWCFIGLWLTTLIRKENRQVRLNYHLLMHCFKKLDYLFLPICYWIIRDQYFAPHGAFANYNTPQFNPGDIIIGVGSFFWETCWTLGNHLISQAFISNPLTLLGMILFLGLSFNKKNEPVKLESFGFLIIIGVILLIGALLPYIMVGRRFYSFGWDTRYYLLLPIPMAILVLGGIRFLQKRFQSFAQIIPKSVLGALLMACLVETNFNYLRWQAETARTYSWQQNLAAVSELDNYSFLYFIDPQRVARTSQTFSTNHRSHQLFAALNRETILGMDEDFKASDTDDKTIHDLILDTNVAGAFRYVQVKSNKPRARLVIRTNFPQEDCYRIAVKYLVYCYFAPEGMEPFLRKLTSLQLVPLDAPLL